MPINRSKFKFSPQQLAFLEEVRAAVETLRGNWQVIADSSGGTLTYSWITNFMQGRIREPSFLKIVVLARFAGLQMGWQPCASLNDAAREISETIQRDLGLTPKKGKQ